MTNTAPAAAATSVSGSGTRESSTWDAAESVTTSAVKSAARAALSCVPDMSIAGECAMSGCQPCLKVR
ncbi:hypothetical protein GCM10010388_70210 [Streptomyces mauvecolor]